MIDSWFVCHSHNVLYNHSGANILINKGILVSDNLPGKDLSGIVLDNIIQQGNKDLILSLVFFRRGNPGGRSVLGVIMGYLLTLTRLESASNQSWVCSMTAINTVLFAFVQKYTASARRCSFLNMYSGLVNSFLYLHKAYIHLKQDQIKCVTNQMFYSLVSQIMQ